MTDSPTGSGNETFASIADAAKALIGDTPDEVPAQDSLEQQKTEQADPAGEGNQESDEDAELAEYADAEEDGEPTGDNDDPQYAGGKFAADDANVRLPDGTVTTVAKLREGNLFQAEFTKKTMALAEERKALETRGHEYQAKQAEVDSLKAQLEQHSEVVQHLAGYLMPKEPDPSMLDERSEAFDPVSYQHQKALYDKQVDYLRQLDGHRVSLRERAEQERQDNLKAHFAKERAALFEKLPALAKPENYQRFFDEATKAGEHYGYTAEDVRAIGDHRNVLVLQDALKYRRIVAKRAEAKAKGEGKPPVMSGGKRQSTADVHAHRGKAAMARLNETGSVRDGVAALLALQKTG